MKQFLVGLILLACVVPISAGTATIKGKLFLADNSVTDGLILVNDPRDRDAEPTKHKIGADGNFQVEIEEGFKVITVAHPDHDAVRVFVKPKEGDVVEFEVKLDYYAPSADGTWYVLLEEDEWKFSEKKEMTPLGDGSFVFEKKSDAEAVRYQICTDRSFNGDDKVVDCDPAGDFVSEVAVVDGVAKIKFNPTKKSWKTGITRSWIKNIQGVPSAAGVSLASIFFDGKRVIEGQVDDPELARELADRCRIVFEMEPAEKRELLSQFIFSRIGHLDPSFDRTDQLNAKLKEDPGFIDEIGFDSFSSMNPDYHKLRGDSNAWVKSYESWAVKYFESEAKEDSKIRGMYSLSQEIAEHSEERAEYWRAQLIEKYPDSSYARRLQKIAAQASLVGSMAPEIALNAPDGTEVKLSSFRGKYVLVDFWATWCGPCIGELPNLVSAYSKVDKSRVEFLSVCLDKEGPKLKAFAKKHKATWTQVGTSGNFEADVARTYNISAIPMMVLVGPDGKVVGVNVPGLRGPKIAETLERYYNNIN